MLNNLRLVAAGLVLACLYPVSAAAHCDALDGPVIKAARKALDSGNPAIVLMWVPEADEAAIKAAFVKTLHVRRLGPEARALADMYFFETVVRVHRASEGAAYTGLKPAGLDHGPVIPAADNALETGSADALVRLIVTAVESGVREQFAVTRRAKTAAIEGDVPQGRAFVHAYVAFVHYVERLYEAAETSAHGHAGTAAPGIRKH